ncbi:MAG: hypothetical protein KJN76_11270, partial [Eudoraea sp.]|nr:hypothetical protein [Eudoraea sp.]
MKILKALLLLIWLSSYFTENQTDDPSTLWFGYYQEDGASNPEDPMPGFVYLNIPNDGTFEGELFFSYAGCDGTFDVGRVSGTVSEGKITGNWEGMVDGKAVGGKYNGTLNAAKNSYRGTYTNANGKQEIPCGDMGGYYVAPHGTWSIKGNDSQGDFCCGTEILAEEEYAQFTWEEIPNADVYRYIIIDKRCLMEKMNLE